jgi:16S rRNA (guanine527-N7)-methyltransferase
MDDPELAACLGASQRLGMLGDRPIDEVVDHATAFVDALTAITGTVVDLGSGGGVPGLVIARARPDLRLVLVDRRAARADHLVRLVRRLGLDDRVTVRAHDATTLTLEPPADAAVARGFGPPARTLPAASRLVRDGGTIVVSEPPDSPAGRWPVALLDDAGVDVVLQGDPRVVVFHRRDVPRGTSTST